MLNIFVTFRDTEYLGKLIMGIFASSSSSRERSGSVIECLTRDRRAAGSPASLRCGP